MTYRFAKAYPDRLLTLSDEVLGKLDLAGEGELKILLLVAGLLRFGPREEEEIVSALEKNYTREETVSALAFWRGCGILKTDTKGKKTGASPVLYRPETESEEEEAAKKTIDADEAPFYSAKDLADAAEATPAFKSLVAFTEERLEKVLNQSELARLYSFLDYLKMPVEVVMLVIEDAVSREKKSLRYVTKVLTSFQDEGITSYEKAEAYFIKREEKNRYATHVRRLFGWGDRKLAKSEEEILEIWQYRFAYGEDMLDAAYEKTVESAKNPSLKYMHKILESWYAAGARTPEEAAQRKSGEEKAEKSYDLDDFFQKAIAKGRKDL